MLKPNFTIVTVCKNCIDDLKKTVKSVVSQNYEQLDYIIIDSDSNDGTKKFLASLPSSIRFISEIDSGIADAFNKAISMAKGDSLLFLNAGDVFTSSSTLSTICNLIPSNVSINESIIYGDFITENKDGTSYVQADHTKLYLSNSINHQSAFVGTNIYKKINYDNRLILGMDYDFWLKCLKSNYKFIKIDAPIAIFCLGGRSSSPIYLIHNEMIRFYLRAINGSTTITYKDVFKIFISMSLLKLKISIKSILFNKSIQ
jgi:glycosyltransferase involved in cell wall biosynthesis